MLEIGELVASYPLAVLTVPFAIVLLYWLFVVLGALDIDLFHGADAAAAGAKGALEGASKGVLEGATKGVVEGASKGVLEGASKGVLEGATKGVLEGASKGVLEGATKGVLEGASKGVLEGASKGVLEGASKGVLEGAAKGTLEGASKAAAEGLAGAVAQGAVEGATAGAADAASLSALAALKAVPATVTLSIWIALSWLLCATGAQWLLGSLEGALFGLAATGILLGSLLLSMPPTAFLIRPLGRLFVTRQAKGHRDLVGRVCVVRTGTVGENFGQAALEDGSLNLLLQVRAEPGQTLRRNDRVLIVAWDPMREAFSVEPLDPILADAADPSVASSRSPASLEALGDDPFEGTTESASERERERER